MTNLELLATTTVHMALKLEDGMYSNGTGFYFAFERTDTHIDKFVIITNKHVVEDSVDLTIKVFPKVNGKPVFEKHFEFVLDVKEEDWIFHPDPDVDLCMLPFEQHYDQIKSKHKDIYFFIFDKRQIPSSEEIERLNTIEDVTMIGYPLGLHDEENNMPFFRRGITSIHPKYDYNGEKEFIIDMSILPGSSGSPVMIYDEGAYKTAQGNFDMGGRNWLMGILYAEPSYELEAVKRKKIRCNLNNIIVNEIPTNLGYVIKSERILEMEELYFEE